MRAMHQLDNDTCVEEERDEDADVEEEPIGNGMDGEQEEEYDGDKVSGLMRITEKKLEIWLKIERFDQKNWKNRSFLAKKRAIYVKK
ncbi:hypothetical protein CRE_15116 [Caenorhabditis remanei]|uniref:Uncharacterized protein n=1 Tax=Caenorhabditis remanei TaxID=31234 RepID=E3NQ10_CAERE|nr:hypothetical protein CRE_15116 [Caenorhabditis remanei]